MIFNSNIHHRKKIRLKDYDYSNEGMYFITICTKNRLQLLGKVICRGEHCSPELNFTYIGKICNKYLSKIEEIYSNSIIDEYIIMPNHIHILIILKIKENYSVSQIVQHYKSKVTKEIGYSIWQKSFYEHIVRNENEYLLIKEYIQNNPINWKKDIYF